MKKIVLALGVASVLGSGSALATTGGCPLKFFGDDTGVITWQPNRLDSPLDSNSERLAVHVLRQDSNDYAGAYNTCSGLEGKLVGEVKNLSFDFLNQSSEPSVHLGAGAPRYSVDLDTDGDGLYNRSVFLSAFYCSYVLSENPAWSRADFTGRILPGCSIWDGATEYASDGSKSAWKLFAEANPTFKLMTWAGPAYLNMDEEGTAFVDRLAFGKKMYIRSGTSTAAIKNCPSESSC